MVRNHNHRMNRLGNILFALLNEYKCYKMDNYSVHVAFILPLFIPCIIFYDNNAAKVSLICKSIANSLDLSLSLSSGLVKHVVECVGCAITLSRAFQNGLQSFQSKAKLSKCWHRLCCKANSLQ